MSNTTTTYYAIQARNILGEWFDGVERFPSRTAAEAAMAGLPSWRGECRVERVDR